MATQLFPSTTKPPPARLALKSVLLCSDQLSCFVQDCLSFNIPSPMSQETPLVLAGHPETLTTLQDR